MAAILVAAPGARNASWAAAKSAPPAPEGASLDKYNEDVQALAAQVRDVIVFGTEGGEASDEDVKAKAQTLAKPVKNYFLVYGLRNGRMVLDKKLYAATPEYQTMYEVLGSLNKFKDENPPAFVGAPTPRIPADLSKELLEKLSEIP